MSRLMKLTAVIGAAFLLSCFATPQTSQSGRLRLIPIVSDQRIEDIQESPDHTRLLTHDRGYSPRLWEPKSMRLLGVLPHTFAPVTQALMSSSGLTIGTISYDEARVWDAKSARTLMSWNLFESKNEEYSRIAISPDDKIIAVAGAKGTIWIARSPLFRLERVSALPGQLPVGDIQFSPNGKYIAACGTDNGKVLLYNIADQKQTVITIPDEGAGWVEFAPDDSQLLVTGLDNNARLFQVPDAKPLHTFEHVVGEKGYMPNTLMAALFVGQNLSEILVCGPTGTMTVYDRKTFVKKRELKGYSRPVREIRKSRDGLRIATFEDNEDAPYEPLKIWNVETTKEYPFTRGPGGPTAGALNYNGTAFWIGYTNGDIIQHRLSDGQWDTNTISAVRPFAKIQFIADTGRVAVLPNLGNNTFFVFDSRKVQFEDDALYTSGSDTLNFSPSGQYALSPAFYEDEEGNEVTAPAGWDLINKKIRILFYPTINGTDWLPNSNRFIAWDTHDITVWDPSIDEDKETEESEQFVKTLFQTDKNIRFAVPSKDGKYTIVDCQSTDESDIKEYFSVVDNETGEVVSEFTNNELLEREDIVAFADQPIFLSGAANLYAYDPKTGKLLYQKETKMTLMHHVHYAPDGSYMIFAQTDQVTKFDPKTGNELNSQKTNIAPDLYLQSTWDPKSEYLALYAGRQVALVNAKTFKHIVTLTRPDTVANVEILAAKNRIVIVDSTEQATIWDLNELLTTEHQNQLEPLGSLILMQPSEEFKTGSWLVMDRDGRFDAPDPNNVTGASYVLEWDGGLEPIDVSQLKSLYYEPGLFGKLVGYDPEPVREVPNRKSIRLFPEISIERSERSPNRVNITLQDRDQGGVGKINIYVNNKLVSTRDGTGFVSLNLDEFKAYCLPASQLPEGKGNTLSVVASNKRGDLSSLPATLDIGIPENLSVPEVNVYGLFVGVGDYVGAKKDLSAPPMDAIDLAKAIDETSERLLPGHVHITTLTTNDKDNLPNRQPILDWFADVAKKATSSDIIVVFFAGHGTSTIGDQKGYFFLTAGANPDDVTPALLGVHTISSDDLQSALSKIPATKQVIILDTCHSGAAAKDIITDRASGSDYVRAYESIRDSSGTWLLAGAAADQLSYEARSVDHGLLTYSLLEAIDRVSPEGLRATPSGELFLDVERWLSYAASRVESLRNEIGIDGIQKPELKRSKNDTSFDLGVTREQFRGEIGLKPPKTIVLMGTFDQDGEDKLGLETALSNALKDEPTFKLWLNVAKHPNVFRIAGQYINENGKVTVRLFIQKLNASQERSNIKTIVIEGVPQDIPGLVQKIREALNKELPTLAKPAETTPGQPPQKQLALQK